MQCVRCGATFDGSFCPRCGTPAPTTALPAAAAAAPGWPCPRCGTVFRGHFCPRCGLPTAAWAYRPPPSPSGGRSVLSILWTLAMVGFLVLALTDFAALLWSPTMVVPGIQGIQSGANVNSGLDFDGNWTPDQWGTGSSLAYQSAGGNLGGYLEMTLPTSGARGFWWQAFEVPVGASLPFAAVVRLDVQITGPLTSGRLLVSVDSSTSNPDPLTAIGSENFTTATAWTATPQFDADGRLPAAGIYYLKIAFVDLGSSGPVNVGFDNIRLLWTTDAGVFVYVPLPTPVVVYRSQDKPLFLAYYGLVVLAILVAGGYYAYADRKRTWDAIRAPLQSIGTRLRSRSAWLAIAQVWMAVTFFQLAFILLLELAQISPTSPIEITTANAWVFLFELANAGVYEELAFRVALIGLPMALGSVVLRLLEVSRGGAGPGSAGRHVAGSLRYLLGGTLRGDSPRETLVAAWAFLFASSAIFGLAHAPGWGWWKVIPAMVAGLGFGYLFLRHGVGAAMLAHFVNDYVDSLYFEGVGGEATLLLTELLVLGLAVAGAGFFAWYALHATNRFQELVRSFRPPVQAPPASPVPPYPASPPPGLPSSEFPPPSPPSLAWPPASTSSAPPPVATVRDPARIPRDYAPTYVPPPYGYPPVRFQCPNCAWVEARYDAGRFTCTRCGRTA